MNGFPRVASYSACKGSGFPLVKADGALDEPLIQKLARHQAVTLDITPWYSPYQAPRADALLLLRKLNPSISIYFYHVLGWFWLGADFTSQHRTFADAFHDEVKAAGAFFPNGNVDVAKAEAGLTKLFCGAAASRLANGVFWDFCSAVNAASVPAIERMIHAVRQAGGPGFKVIGNGWQDTFNLDGNMKEGFPDNLPNVTFEHIRQWRAGRPHRTDDWLQAGTGFFDPTTPAAQRAARFAHGTACLFDMQCSVGPDRDLKVVPYYGTWWADFYDGGGLGAGWLGEPIGDYTTNLQGTFRRDFAGGVVLVNSAASPQNITLPKGLCRFDGQEMGSITVAAKDAAFLVRAR